MYILNVPRFAVEYGKHDDPTENSVLIQISDTDLEFPTPCYEFGEVHRFKFNDVSYEDMDGAITDEQAAELVKILQAAKEKNANVIVHCTAGICRSGAVTEVGVMLGFDEPSVGRIPNVLVKTKMLRQLGWTYE